MGGQEEEHSDYARCKTWNEGLTASVRLPFHRCRRVQAPKMVPEPDVAEALSRTQASRSF